MKRLLISLSLIQHFLGCPCLWEFFCGNEDRDGIGAQQRAAVIPRNLAPEDPALQNKISTLGVENFFDQLTRTEMQYQPTDIKQLDIPNDERVYFIKTDTGGLFVKRHHNQVVKFMIPTDIADLSLGFTEVSFYREDGNRKESSEMFEEAKQGFRDYLLQEEAKLTKEIRINTTLPADARPLEDIVDVVFQSRRISDIALLKSELKALGSIIKLGGQLEAKPIDKSKIEANGIFMIARSENRKMFITKINEELYALQYKFDFNRPKSSELQLGQSVLEFSYCDTDFTYPDLGKYISKLGTFDPTPKLSVPSIPCNPIDTIFERIRSTNVSKQDVNSLEIPDDRQLHFVNTGTTPLNYMLITPEESVVPKGLFAEYLKREDILKFLFLSNPVNPLAPKKGPYLRFTDETKKIEQTDPKLYIPEFQANFIINTLSMLKDFTIDPELPTDAQPLEDIQVSLQKEISDIDDLKEVSSEKIENTEAKPINPELIGEKQLCFIKTSQMSLVTKINGTLYPLAYELKLENGKVTLTFRYSADEVVNCKKLLNYFKDLKKFEAESQQNPLPKPNQGSKDVIIEGNIGRFK